MITNYTHFGDVISFNTTFGTNRESWHRPCTFHILKNAIKHLPKQEKDNVSNILADFSACMFEYEEKGKFEKRFFNLEYKSRKQTWLDSIYKLKEK
jgi:hypothetical protein